MIKASSRIEKFSHIAARFSRGNSEVSVTFIYSQAAFSFVAAVVISFLGTPFCGVNSVGHLNIGTVYALPD